MPANPITHPKIRLVEVPAMSTHLPVDPLENSMLARLACEA
jgi:hypothetical protein